MEIKGNFGEDEITELSDAEIRSVTGCGASNATAEIDLLITPLSAPETATTQASGDENGPGPKGP